MLLAFQRFTLFSSIFQKGVDIDFLSSRLNFFISIFIPKLSTYFYPNTKLLLKNLFSLDISLHKSHENATMLIDYY